MALTRTAAVVLAGGARDAVAALEPGAPNKAFVRVAGRTLLARTLDAIDATPALGPVVVVAPRSARGRPELATSSASGEPRDVRDDGPTMTESLRSGLRGFDPDALVFVCASDLPILDRTAIDDFLARALASNADLVYATVERSAHEARFPEVPHTWATLRDGTFCGGGCIAMRPRVLPALEAVLGALGAARKNPLRLAGIFGLPTLLRYATKRLTIAQVERRASRILRAPAAVAVCAYPQIAVNVDRTGDVALAERLLTENGAAGR